MRRLLPLLLLSSILLGACSPVVTLLSSDPSSPKTHDPAATLLPSTAIPSPTPTRPPNLGISPDALRGMEVVIWHGWDGTSSSLFEQMAAEFTLTNKWGLKVSVVPQHNLNLLAAEVDKSLRAPEQPDIVVALPEQILAWQDNILDLSPYAAQSEFGLDQGEIPSAFLAQSQVGNVIYSLPASRSARFLFYNLSFAQDLGFTSVPHSFEEFRAQACAANGSWKQDGDLTNDGFGGLALDAFPNWQTPYSWLAAADGQVFSEGKFHFNTPENISALENITKLREADCAWLGTETYNYDYFAQRRALFITGSLSDIAAQKIAFTSSASTDDWTVLPFPGKKPVIVAYGPDYAILKSSEARQLASWLFIRWMLEAENQYRWSRETGLFPVTLSGMKMLWADPAITPQLSAALNLIQLAANYPQTAHWQVADTILADGFMAYFERYPFAALDDVLELMDATIADLNE